MKLTNSPSVSLLALLVSVICEASGQYFNLSYKIDEELPVYSVVGNIGRDSNIYELLSAEDYASLRYRILLYPETHNNYFTIVNTTGVLKTASPIDRELICFYETTCKLSLHVAAQTESGQQFYTFKVTVFVLDINDNSPTFSMSSMTIKIDEDAAVGTSISIMSATDNDILNNTLQTYTLVTASDMFGLKATRNLDDSLTPVLYVKAPLDRERQAHYFMKVLALDGGVPVRSGELSINVTLNDVNDNAPRFSKQTYDEYVPEVTAIGQRVMTLTATDDDVGNNGRVTFRLGARQSEEAFNTFRLVANTGDILSLRDLTPLQGQTMRLVVEAIDQGVKPQTAQAVVNIHVTDSVNNAPIIRMTIPPGSPVSRIIENASPGFVVAHFLVEDADSGENGAVACHLQDDTFGLQRLKEDEYKVTVYSGLDRERVPFYDVTITCMDGGSPSLTTNVAFSVILDDANDNPPRFLKSVYRANISENLNGVILRLEAEDIDLGQNGSVSYRLGNVTPLVSSFIQVNPTTGEINTKQVLDHELFKQLDFQVVAADSGIPSLSSTARVIIDVIDENDNVPRVSSGYYMTVPENRPPGTIIGYIHAIDPDEGPAGKIGYRLRGDNEGTELFNLSITGEIRTLKMFDREKRDVYYISVLAWDYGESPHSSDFHIKIVITDDNDHAPIIEFPRATNKTVYITLDARYNSTVTSVLASDDDVGENASLYYAIIDGGKDVFEVDERTGRVFTMRNLYGPDKGTYNIKLSVKDGGRSPLTTTGNLVVVVIQGNSTVAYITFASNEHIIVAAILVGITIFIAIVVLLIVIRFLKKERQDRSTAKYTGGLPLEVKKRAEAADDDVASEDGPWRRYDAAKRQKASDVAVDPAYECRDDIIMFKLKLADEYRELEPEDKDPGCNSLSRKDGSPSRVRVIADPDIGKNRSMTRLATFQGRPTAAVSPGFVHNQAQKDKVWRTVLKEKIADEILSSSSRETTGADSGRGASEDGSQSRSSITDDSGCLISPSHSLLRGNNTKLQGNYSRPTSGSGYDPPPLLMTFQGNAPDAMTTGGGSSIYGTRNPTVAYHSSPVPRSLNGYDKNLTNHVDAYQVGAKDLAVHRNQPGVTPQHDYLNNTELKSVSPNLAKSVNGPKSEPNQLNDRANGRLHGSNRVGYPGNKIKDARLCSEPPLVEVRDKPTSPYNTRGIQETGPTITGVPSNTITSGVNKSVYLSGSEKDRYTEKGESIYPPSPRFLQASPAPYGFKQAVSPVCRAAINPDPHSQNTLPVAHRSVTFKCQNVDPTKSIQEKLRNSLDADDDGNTTTTSDSYTIDAEELSFDVPHTDVFV